MPKRVVSNFQFLYLILTLAAVIVVVFTADRALKYYHLTRSETELEIRARLAAAALPATFPDTPLDSLQTFIMQQAWVAQTRLTLIGREGRVLGESDLAQQAVSDPQMTADSIARQRPLDPADLETLTYRPEVRDALAGQVGRRVRRSMSLAQDVLYVAVPVLREGVVLGAIRAASPLNLLAPDYEKFQTRFMLYVAGTLLAALALMFWLTQSLNRPLAEMKLGAERFAFGDFSRRIDIPTTPELAGLADALNKMGGRLGETISAITIQRNEQEAILTSLRESVIAIDPEEHVLFLNRAAAELLGVDAERAVGRSLPEVVRNSQLHEYIGQVLAGQTESDANEITVRYGANTTLQVSGTTLKDSRGNTIGALIVINDISRLKKLENIRREFVANVSHELRTPITSIKGFVETLIDAGLEDEAVVRDFLSRIEQNTDRLNAIIDDLLSLSQIELDGERGTLILMPGSLGSVGAAAVSHCRHKADEMGVELRYQCEQDIVLPIHAVLLEQAVFNLVDNAVKYSEPRGLVTVTVGREQQDAVIRVKDRGIGIPAEHLSRIFERFYRVDKGRSRKSGGTGLGLAIVKHIVQAHGGRVEVQSTAGQGSEFQVRLPMPPA